MKYIKCILSLTFICAVMTALLACVNHITAPIIAKNEEAKAFAALAEVLPGGSGFEKLDISALELPSTVNEVYTEENGGIVVKLTTQGFNPNMVIMVGINADKTVSGTTCLSSEETLGYEKTYSESVLGASIDSIDSVDTVAGATKTTAAYRNAVRDAINTAIVAGGGEAVKSEEEIFAENLALALPTADGFTPVFMLEKLEGIDDVYEANNGAGFVVIIGDKFIATDANGKVITAGLSTEEKAAATSAATMISAWELTPLDLSSYEMPSAIVGAYTYNDTYVFELNAAGYGINGGSQYKPASGKYIEIRLSMSRDGEIIDCVTVAEDETDGFGDACANADFYSQFDGKTASDYTEIDAIGGATVTTDGYVKAVGSAFEALEILKGGNENEAE